MSFSLCRKYFKLMMFLITMVSTVLACMKPSLNNFFMMPFIIPCLGMLVFEMKRYFIIPARKHYKDVFLFVFGDCDICPSICVCVFVCRLLTALGRSDNNVKLLQYYVCVTICKALLYNRHLLADIMVYIKNL